jgi:endonuclease YncB( thermonuclease family)
VVDVRGLYEATVRRWVDADTCDVEIATMPERGQYTRDRIRLNRIDADKDTTDEGRAGTAFCESLIPAGAAFQLQIVKVEKFGRLLSEVWIGRLVSGAWIDAGNLNDMLVANGHADYWDGQGPRPRGVAPFIRIPRVEEDT